MALAHAPCCAQDGTANTIGPIWDLELCKGPVSAAINSPWGPQSCSKSTQLASLLFCSILLSVLAPGSQGQSYGWAPKKHWVTIILGLWNFFHYFTFTFFFSTQLHTLMTLKILRWTRAICSFSDRPQIGHFIEQSKSSRSNIIRQEWFMPSFNILYPCICKHYLQNIQTFISSTTSWWSLCYFFSNAWFAFHNQPAVVL